MQNAPQDPKGFRPKAFPPPQFPPHRPGRFARMPPAVFPAILGLLGLGLLLRRAVVALTLPPALADILLGAMVALWAFAAFGLAVKISRRPAVVLEDLKTLPGRAGFAAAVLGLYLSVAAIAPFAPALGKALLVVGMAMQAALAARTLWVWIKAPPEAREITPVWHLTFVGFIVAALAALPLGWKGLAAVLFWITLPVAVAIWGVSAVQLIRRIPPAPLRPLLAIHLAPASLLATVGAGVGQTGLALGMLALSALIALALVAAGRWITEAGFTALWGAFTFPLSAFGSALFVLGFDVSGTMVLIGALGVIPWIGYRVMKLWAGGQLAVKTNAAEA